MSLIGKPIVEFSADAYYNGEFIKVSMMIYRENGRFFVSIPLISHLFAQRNLVIYKNNMQSFKNLVLKCILFQQIRISFIKLGTMILMLSEQSLTL